MAEILLGLGLLWPATRELAAGSTIGFLLLIFPANILAALQHLNYQTGAFDGPGPRYLLFRGPLQTFFIAWAWYFGLHLPA